MQYQLFGYLHIFYRSLLSVGSHPYLPPTYVFVSRFSAHADHNTWKMTPTRSSVCVHTDISFTFLRPANHTGVVNPFFVLPLPDSDTFGGELWTTVGNHNGRGRISSPVSRGIIHTMHNGQTKVRNS